LKFSKNDQNRLIRPPKWAPPVFTSSSGGLTCASVSEKVYSMMGLFGENAIFNSFGPVLGSKMAIFDPKTAFFMILNFYWGGFGSDNFASRCLLDKKFQIFVGPFWTCKLRVFGISKILKSPKITNFSKNRPNPTWITKKWSVSAFVSLESRPKFRKKDLKLSYVAQNSIELQKYKFSVFSERFWRAKCKQNIEKITDLYQNFTFLFL